MRTTPIQYDYRYACRKTGVERRLRRWYKRQANRAFRRVLNEQVRTRQIDACSEFNANPGRHYLSPQDIS